MLDKGSGCLLSGSPVVPGLSEIGAAGQIQRWTVNRIYVLQHSRRGFILGHDVA